MTNDHFTINVIKKQTNTINLLFSKITVKGKPNLLVLSDEKEEYIPVSYPVSYGYTRIPSTLLSNWININFQDKLLTLVDRCNTVEHIKESGKGEGKYYFTNKPDSIYGLHKRKISTPNGVVRVVSIDDSIGMQFVIAILNEIGYTVDVDWDDTVSKVKEIKLKEV